MIINDKSHYCLGLVRTQTMLNCILLVVVGSRYNVKLNSLIEILKVYLKLLFGMFCLLLNGICLGFG